MRARTLDRYRLGVDAVQLRCSDQGVDGGGAFTAGVGTRKRIVVPAHDDGTQGAFGAVVVDLQPRSSL